MPYAVAIDSFSSASIQGKDHISTQPVSAWGWWSFTYIDEASVRIVIRKLLGQNHFEYLAGLGPTAFHRYQQSKQLSFKQLVS